MGLARCLEANLQTCAPKNSTHVDGGQSRGYHVLRPLSEAPNCREQNSIKRDIKIYFSVLK